MTSPRWLQLQQPREYCTLRLHNNNIICMCIRRCQRTLTENTHTHTRSYIIPSLNVHNIYRRRRLHRLPFLHARRWHDARKRDAATRIIVIIVRRQRKGCTAYSSAKIPGRDDGVCTPPVFHADTTGSALSYTFIYNNLYLCSPYMCILYDMCCIPE